MGEGPLPMGALAQQQRFGVGRYNTKSIEIRGQIGTSHSPNRSS